MITATIKQVDNGYIVEHHKILGGSQYTATSDLVTKVFKSFDEATQYMYSYNLFGAYEDDERK